MLRNHQTVLRTFRLLCRKACSDGIVYVNVPSATRELGVSRRTLMRALQTLRALDLIEWVSRHKGVYRVLAVRRSRVSIQSAPRTREQHVGADDYAI